MSYIDGFVIAVPTANKGKFIEHAKKADSLFKELGATRILECWGNDVPEGKFTDFRKAFRRRRTRRSFSPGSSGPIKRHVTPLWPEWTN